MVHAVRVEQVEREALALIARGADLTVAAVLAHFEADLLAEPATSALDPDQLALRRAVGVA